MRVPQTCNAKSWVQRFAAVFHPPPPLFFETKFYFVVFSENPVKIRVEGSSSSF